MRTANTRTAYARSAEIKEGRTIDLTNVLEYPDVKQTSDVPAKETESERNDTPVDQTKEPERENPWNKLAETVKKIWPFLVLAGIGVGIAIAAKKGLIKFS